VYNQLFIRESKKLDIEAGLRAEQTNVFYDLSPENIYYSQNDSYKYFNLYPNIRITYKINSNNSLSGYINKRVDRPGEPELRVFPKYDDPELLKVGNPYLRPQFLFQDITDLSGIRSPGFTALIIQTISMPLSTRYIITLEAQLTGVWN
jgi:hypothetical protein